MPDVMVTGAAGFLGRYIVEQLLAKGASVRGLCRRPAPELAAQGVEIVIADLRDREAVIAACEGVETIHHVAGVAGIWGPWRHYFDINTQGTRHVLEGCRRHGVSRLVYTSSPSVTFSGGDQCGIDEREEYPREWLCHYPHTKALAEQEVLAANGHDGLATCALRPHLIWGPRDRHLIPRLLDRARKGRLRRVGDGNNLIDTTYVEDAARAHLLAADKLSADSPVGGRAYFISQGAPVKCWEWIDELLALAGLPPVKKLISVGAAWKLGHAMELAWKMLRLSGEPPMTRFLAAQLGHHHYFDISRARHDFGYEPRFTQAEGMQKLAAELREA